MTAAAAQKNGKAAEPRGVVRDQGYQRYTGPRDHNVSRWWLICKRMLSTTARHPGVLTMLIIALVATAIGALIMYTKVRTAQMMPGAPPARSFIFDFATWSPNLLLTFLCAMFAGSGAIADDVRSGASQFYFSRPVQKWEYFLGKLLPPFFLVSALCVVPGVLLAATLAALAQNGSEVWAAFIGMGMAVALGLLEALVMTVPVVMLSSMMRSRGYVQGAYAMLFALPWVAGGLVAHLMRTPWPAVLSLPAHLIAVGERLFGVEVPPAEAEATFPLWVSLVLLGCIVLGCSVILQRRLARMEILGK